MIVTEKVITKCRGLCSAAALKQIAFNNYIINGRGSGIVVASIGGQKIYNNIIIQAGFDYYPNDLMMMQHGIYVGDISTFQDSSFVIANNLIINPKSDGIRFTSLKSANNLAVNNIVVNPGNYGFYDTLHTQFTARDAYIMVSDSSIHIDTLNNFFSRNLDGIGFTDTLSHKYTLKASSPLIDVGYDISALGISVDAFNNPRYYGNNYDIGPFEYNSQVQGVSNFISQSGKFPVYPNPVESFLFVTMDGFDEYSPKHLSIYSLNGTIIWMDSIQQIHNKEQLRIDVSNFKPGVYMIIINTEKEQYLRRFIKL
jgi:hypothetical protein